MKLAIAFIAGFLAAVIGLVLLVKGDSEEMLRPFEPGDDEAVAA